MPYSPEWLEESGILGSTRLQSPARACFCPGPIRTGPARSGDLVSGCCVRSENSLQAVATCYGLDFREFLYCPGPTSMSTPDSDRLPSGIILPHNTFQMCSTLRRLLVDRTEDMGVSRGLLFFYRCERLKPNDRACAYIPWSKRDRACEYTPTETGVMRLALSGTKRHCVRRRGEMSCRKSLAR